MERLNRDASKRKYSVVDALIDGPQPETVAPVKPAPAPEKPDAEEEVTTPIAQKPRRRTGTIRREAEGNTSKLGCKQGEVRFSFIIREDYEEKIKALAHLNRLNIKEMMDEIITEYMEKKKVRDVMDEAMTEYANRKNR